MPQTQSLYNPYGAFELKASYHRNLFIANLSVLSLVVIVVLSFWIVSMLQPPMVVIDRELVDEIRIIKDIPPPPKIKRAIYEDKVKPPKQEIKNLAILIPVDDDSLIIEEVIELDKVEDTANVGYDTLGVEGLLNPDAGLFNGNGNSGGEIFFPEPTEFIPFEKPAKLIKTVTPQYPRLCKKAGLEGVVTVQVFVGIDGTVKKAIVAESSGITSFDEAAIKAAYENVFSPALQNKIPVALWVTYKVEFKLYD